METETKSQHSWQIETQGNKHRARCSCGWQGLRRVYMSDARSEGTRHELTANR